MGNLLLSTEPLALLTFLLTCLGWTLGGWLLTWLFPLRPGERPVTGVALGLALYVTLVNLLTRFTGLPAASLLSAGLILAWGAAAAWHEKISLAGVKESLRSWSQLAALLALGGLFVTAQQGVGIFDEFVHLPMISVMAAGDIPPHFYLNPGAPFAYHHSLQVLAAALVRVARFLPWSAWDLSKGVAIALTISLGWLWVRRMTHNRTMAALGALAIGFAGGARWLLLLTPPDFLSWLSQSVQMSTNAAAATAPTLASALTRPWGIEGGGAQPFAFAYHNGVFAPVFFFLGSTGALPFMLTLLLLLLNPGRRLTGLNAAGVLALALACLAFSGEHLFVFLWGVAVLAIFISLLRRKLRLERSTWLWLGTLAASAVLGLVQGGYITETALSLLGRLSGAVSATSNLYGFSLRWPPAVPTAHTNSLSLFYPAQFILLLFELGAALFMAPAATSWAWRAAKRGDWLTAGIGFSALLMMLFTLFFDYGLSRSGVRLPNTALWLWVVLGFPLVAWGFAKRRKAGQALLAAGYAILLLGGLVTFGLQITSAPEPVAAPYIGELDIPMARAFWNKLEPGALVFDPAAERSVVLFGKASPAKLDVYVFMPEWEALAADPRPDKVAAAGFTYVYMDDVAWRNLKNETEAAYKQPCVRLVKEVLPTAGVTFRRLLDARTCR